MLIHIEGYTSLDYALNEYDLYNINIYKKDSWIHTALR